MECEAEQRASSERKNPRRALTAPAPHDLFKFEQSISEDGRRRRGRDSGRPIRLREQLLQASHLRSQRLILRFQLSADGAISLGVTGSVTGLVALRPS